MQIGVMVNGDGLDTLTSQMEAARAAGYAGVQITPAPVGLAQEVRDLLAANSLTLFALGGYINPLRDDPAHLQDAIALAAELGVPIVHTWSGTAAADIFDDDAANQDETTFEQCVAFFRQVANWAADAGVVVAIEPFHHHVARSPERLRAMLDAVGSAQIAAAMDPPNFLPVDVAASVNERMPGMFAALDGKIAIAHAKDLRVPLPGETAGVLGGVVLPGPGEGIMDYDLYTRLLLDAGVGVITTEHIPPAAFRSAREVVDRSLRANGVS